MSKKAISRNDAGVPLLESAKKQTLLILASRASRGDIRAARTLLEMDRGPTARLFDLPSMESLADIAKAHTAVIEAAARGDVSAHDADKLSRMLDRHGEAMERKLLEEKLLFVEMELNESPDPRRPR